MIARLAYTDGDGDEQVATLGEDGHWTCSDAAIGRVLDDRIAAEDRSPARGNWMAWHARKMAEVLGAEVEVEEKRPAPEGALH
jgi:hypothetical protein